MIKIPRSMKFLTSLTTGLTFALGLTATGVVSAAGKACLPFGEAATTPTETKILQHGAKLYFNYCASCHSIKYMRYSRLATDLELTEAQVLDNFAFTGAKIGDFAVSNMPVGGRGHPPGAQEWFGQAPPDLSLTARSRGTNWIYNYLKSFYVDPSRPVGWNNLTFPNASMPNPLWELQGTQSHQVPEKAEHKEDSHGQDPACSPEALKVQTPGTRSAQQFEQDILALTSFLEYVGEPAVKNRETIGIWVLVYLSVLTLLLYLLKSEYWKDVH